MTNSLGFLNQCDSVVYLEDGCIVESGKYDELRARDGPFARFLFSKQNDDNDATAQQQKRLRSDSDREGGEKCGGIFRSELSLVSASTSIRRRINSDLTTGDEEEKLIELEPMDDRIIEREHVQTGGVKFAVLIQYLRACRIRVFLCAFSLFVLSFAFDMASNYWLSDWSNQSRDTQKSLSSKFYRVVVYFILGFAKSIHAVSRVYFLVQKMHFFTIE